MVEYWIGQDSIGGMRAPVDAPYAERTQPAFEGFPTSGARLGWVFLRSTGVMESVVNADLGLVKERRALTTERPVRGVTGDGWDD